MSKFAIFVCPTGALAEQIEKFLNQGGGSVAHRSVPGCTLIDGFEEQDSAAPIYTQSLDRAYKRGLKSRPSPAVVLDGLVTQPDGCRLAITAPWLKQVMVNFACTVKSPTRKMPLRIQEDLGLPLAQGFAPAQMAAVAAQAQESIHWQAPTHWEMRFYQRSPERGWICHQSWDLGEGQPALSPELAASLN
jgi:hypothetical protein